MSLIHRTGGLLGLLALGCSPPASDSPVVLVAVYDSGPGAALLELRQDGSCDWIPGMASSVQTGHYRLADSLLTLSGIEPTGALKSSTLLLTTHNPNNAQRRDSVCYAVDEQLRAIDKRFIFWVTRPKSAPSSQP